MSKSIKNLFSLKKSENVSNEDPQSDQQVDELKNSEKTFYETGHNASITAMGKPIVFKACLQNIYSKFEEQCRIDKVKQDKLKEPYVNMKFKLQSELKKIETLNAINKSKVDDLENEIADAKSNMIDVRQNPENYGLDVNKKPKAQLYIGLGLLVPITIYLFVFYISASYSAFFKNFENGSLTAAIFDANALSDAFSAGVLEGILVITIPFVFMGLGYLIHMMQKEKGGVKFLKLAGLFVITFIFDLLLAYIIEEKIYEFNKTLDSPFFNMQVALVKAEFWAIIFAGFVVYLIWGLVFDFMMKEYEELDKINGFISARKSEISDKQEAIKLVQVEIDEIKAKESDVKSKIDEIQSKIDGFIFSAKEYLLYHNQYKEGWFQAITTDLGIPAKEQNLLLEGCEDVCKDHLQGLQLNNHSEQLHVYSRN